MTEDILNASQPTTSVFTLVLATARDGRRFTPASFFVYVLRGPDGNGVRGGETDPVSPLTDAHGDASYVALAEVLLFVPEGSHLRVVTTQEYLCGGPTHAGILNAAPSVRVAGRYRRKGGRGTLANAAQLRAMDEVLLARRITMSATRPGPGEEDGLHARLVQRAKDLMDFDPDAPSIY